MSGIKGINKGKINGMWKENGVSYKGLHQWARRNLASNGKCWDCGKIAKRLDAANISGKYKRDILDWEYLCRTCHMIKDGRLKLLVKSRIGMFPWNKGKKLPQMSGRNNPNYKKGNWIKT